ASRSTGSARAAFAALASSAASMAFGAARWAARVSLRAMHRTWTRARAGRGTGCFVWCWLIRHRVSFPFRNRFAARCLFGGGCGNLLLRRLRSRRRARSLFARPAAGTALAMLSELLLALQFFVQANGLVLDDGVGNLQAPFEL